MYVNSSHRARFLLQNKKGYGAATGAGGYLYWLVETGLTQSAGKSESFSR